MLVTSKELLLDAQKNHYAVGAFNVENMEMVMAVLAAAEQQNSPVIMQTTPGTVKYAGFDFYFANVKAAAERTKNSRRHASRPRQFLRNGNASFPRRLHVDYD